MSDERGLIIHNDLSAVREGISIRSSDLDPQNLRSQLLFWDKLDFPRGTWITFGDGSPEVEFLKQAGVLTRTETILPDGVIDGTMILRSMSEAFRIRELASPGMWSVSTIPGLQVFSKDQMEPGRGILVRLHNAIPVPEKEVPLHDILEFRARRRSELLNLRHNLERIYSVIVASPDRALTEQSEFSALQSAISDHVRVSRESRFSLVNLSVDANVNVTPALVAGVTSYTAGLGLAGSALAAVTTTAASLFVGPSFALKTAKSTAIPFQYVSSFHKELF